MDRNLVAAAPRGDIVATPSLGARAVSVEWAHYGPAGEGARPSPYPAARRALPTERRRRAKRFAGGSAY
jgi:hypothetical protein